MITACLLAWLPAFDACPQCRLEGGEVKPCPPHAGEESDVLLRQGKHLRSKDESERLAALEAIAQLTSVHENAPSPRVVKKSPTW